MKRKWEEPNDETYIPYMASVVLNCPMIQELEIMGTALDPDFIRAKELSAISQCLKLKRLTFSDIIVSNGQFFIPV